jgi:hypothetical protein
MSGEDRGGFFFQRSRRPLSLLLAGLLVDTDESAERAVLAHLPDGKNLIVADDVNSRRE